MKLAIVMVGLSLAVMAVMIFQAVRQELDLRDLKARMLKNSAEVRRKEEAIIDVKNKIKQLETTLASVNTETDELKRAKADVVKSTQDFGKSAQACNTEKADSEKKKTDMAAALTKLRADHGVAKKTAEEDIKLLKQQILDRDKAICAHADTTKEEARKLCGITVAPQ